MYRQPSPPLWPLWSLKHFVMAKEPFNKDFSFLSPKSLNLKSYMYVVVCECDDFLVACYVLTKGPKANQNPSLTCCSNLWGKANQIIFHTFREKSRGLHTRLATVNHRHPFSDFFWREGAAVHRLEENWNVISDSCDSNLVKLTPLKTPS